MEPMSTTSAATLAAAVSGVTLALLGVPYHALVWSFVGALVALSQAVRMPRGRAFAFVALSTLCGAAIGAGVEGLLDKASRAALVMASLVGGYGAQQVLGRALQALLDRITTNQTTTEPKNGN